MDSMEQFRQTYITECHELLEDMEARLMACDQPENMDADSLNAIFRCAHSIKGGAGAFGMDNITRFTHVAEYLLDDLREGKLSVTRAIVDALLQSVDIIAQMVQAAQSGDALPDDFGMELAKELEGFCSTAPAPSSDDPIGVESASSSEHAASVASETVTFYTIHITPKPSLFKTGNEPLLLLRELATLGSCDIEADISTIPPLAELDPEVCYITWKVELESTATEAQINEIFEFVEDECVVEIDSLAGLTLPAASPAHATTLMDADADTDTDAERSSAQQSGNAPSTTTPLPPEASSPAKTSPAATTIRVDLDKVDRLVNLVGELVITQSMLTAQIHQLSSDQHPDLVNGIDELSQHTRELQEAVMSVRMQPVKSIFSRMPRIVRDISSKLGKQITLETVGENTEVDKTVIEQLGDPLTHMIRNAVDHGIEMPDVRADKGKPHEGTIRLSAAHQGGRIIIEITDDGQGINRERVLAIAKDKGIVEAHAQPDAFEIDNLIFKPGFSTAEEVTDISGRGVGMDVVRRNIESLGGSVFIRSYPGKGSTFTVSLPLTLAILDGMIVRVGHEHYIIPIAHIIETLRPAADDIRKIADGNDLINMRGDFISILYLHKIFGVSAPIPDPSKALVVLVENGQDKMGLVVDELIGQQQVVIKSLEANADPTEGISGATILGDGKVSLILDVAQLQGLVSSESSRTHHIVAA